MTPASERLEANKKDIEISLELELSTEIARAFKIIDKTESILSAMLLITEAYRKSNREVKDSDSDVLLIDKIESLVYEIVEQYHTDRSAVRDVLSLMVFYIHTLKLKDIVSVDQHSQLVSAFNALLSAYDELQVSKDTLEMVDIKDIDLEEYLEHDIASDRSRTVADDSEGIESALSERQSDKKDITKDINMDTDVYSSYGHRRGSVQRDLNKRTLSSSSSAISDKRQSKVAIPKFKNIPVTPEPSATHASKRQDSRRMEILRLLSSEPITIKDISTKVLGCSEKTIQRELNSMLDDGTIMRIGEKRWSKYVMA